MDYLCQEDLDRNNLSKFKESHRTWTHKMVLGDQHRLGQLDVWNNFFMCCWEVKIPEEFDTIWSVTPANTQLWCVTWWLVVTWFLYVILSCFRQEQKYSLMLLTHLLIDCWWRPLLTDMWDCMTQEHRVT